MAALELILLQRVEKLGQMGDIVKVAPGFARRLGDALTAREGIGVDGGDAAAQDVPGDQPHRA